MKKGYFGRGKVLITGEYGVLDGALAFAVPTRLGQSMVIKKHRSSDIKWSCKDAKGNEWFKSTISVLDFRPIDTTDEQISEFIRKLLKSAVNLNSEFLDKWNGFKVETTLEFERNWGLGSSSTITHLVAQWADIHPLSLHFRFSNGSGYDVACAGSDSPILYQLDGDNIMLEPLDDFRPSFIDNLYFVHLNAKQSSATSVAEYTKKVKAKKALVKKLTDCTEAIIETKKLADFEQIIQEHENVLANALKRETVKAERFADYWGSVKSLGAWGGDLVLVTSEESQAKTKQYFADKGYATCFHVSDILI